MIKLPRVNLQQFDGSYYNWLTFRDLFEQMIHNSKNVGAFEKFQYLKASLNGDAAQLINLFQ